MTERQYTHGERFLLAGRERVLVLEERDGYAARFDGEVLRVPVRVGTAPEEVPARDRALSSDRDRGDRAADRSPRGPDGARIAAVPGQAPPAPLGSCSRAGRLNFNLRLAMAPPAELEYIVVHKLCHIIHLDHSPAYWRTVERYMPDYGARRAALSAGCWRYGALIRRPRPGSLRAVRAQWPWASSTLFIIPRHQIVQEHHGAPTISIAAG